MLVISIDGAVRHRKPEPAVNRRLPVVTGACLLLMLIFSTATVFVRSAWALQSFQIGIFVLVAACILVHIRREPQPLADGWEPWLAWLIPVWGLVQLVAHTTASTFNTRGVLLRWGALVGVFYLTLVIARTREARSGLLSAFLIFATAMAILCLTQMNTSDGKVLWLFATGNSDVYGTFPSYNSYAQFIELALPIALWRAVREGWRSWWYGICGGILYGSVIGSASRAGATLCTAELLLILGMGFARLQPAIRTSPRSVSRSAPRSAQMNASILVAVPVFAILFTSLVGWERVMLRFQQNDKYLVRREFMLAAVDMAKQKPLLGYGLGMFPEVYQQFAVKDFPFYANHAHNDWAEFAAEGGVPLLLLVLIPFAAVVPSAFRHPWGLGLIATMLHACVDFPFPRPAVSGWMFMMLALLYTARSSDRRQSAAEVSIKDLKAQRSAGQFLMSDR
jgi:O-antigen ligase